MAVTRNRCPHLFRRSVLAAGLLAATLGFFVDLSTRPVLAQAGTDTARLSREWKRATSAHFVVLGNADDGGLREVLAQLEGFRWVFLQMFPTIRLDSPVPTVVVVFRDWDSFARFQPRDEKGKRRENVGGYFMTTPTVSYMVMGAQGNGSDLAREIVFHEFTHNILHANLHDIPIWLNEGLAEYYSTLKIDKDRIVIGMPPTERLRTLRDLPLLPIEKVLSTQSATALLRKGDQDTSRFYAQSWALVHYVTLGNGGKRHAQLSAYFTALGHGASIDEAFQTAFGCTYADLGHELESYVHRFQFPGLAAPIPRNVTADIGPAQPMTQIDAEAFQADLLVHADARDDADKKLAALLRREPSLASARLSLAVLRLAQERREEAADLLRHLVAADAANFGAHVYLAPVLVELGQPVEAVAVAERATALNDRSPAAWSALALAALVAGRQSQADAAMTQVMRLDPDPNHYQARAYDAFRLGREEAAVRDAQSFVKRAGWGHESAPYMAFLMALAHRHAEQPAEADRVLAQARAVVERGSWTEKVLDFFQGRVSGEQLVAQAKDDGERTEAHTYVGFHDVFAGRQEQAEAHFRWVKQRGLRTYTEYPLAVAELARLEKATGSEP